MALKIKIGLSQRQGCPSSMLRIDAMPNFGCLLLFAEDEDSARRVLRAATLLCQHKHRILHTTIQVGPACVQYVGVGINKNNGSVKGLGGLG